MSTSTPSLDIAYAGCDSLQGRFLALLPRIERHAWIFFRHVKCPVKKADCVAETVALCWRWFVRLAERGKDAAQFASVLASFAARAVKSGRTLCGKLKSKDVMNEWTQQRQGFIVSKLPEFTPVLTNPLNEAVTDNRRTPVPDQVVFRCDFPRWLTTLSQRNRRIAQEMAMGERTQDLARKYGMVPGRISQLRREFKDDWTRFCADPAEAYEPLIPAK